MSDQADRALHARFVLTTAGVLSNRQADLLRTTWRDASARLGADATPQMVLADSATLAALAGARVAVSLMRLSPD